MKRRCEFCGLEADEHWMQSYNTERKVCANCKHLKHDDVLRTYKCSVRHLLDVADWRMKYEVCDKWEKR